jgi:hypothetical protein
MLSPRSKAQYELHFKKWGFRKYRSADEWKRVAHKIAQRKRVDKDSEVYLNGILINQKKLRKETLRYGSMPAITEMSLQSNHIHPLQELDSYNEDSIIASNA